MQLLCDDGGGRQGKGKALARSQIHTHSHIGPPSDPHTHIIVPVGTCTALLLPPTHSACLQVNFWDIRVDRLMKKGRKPDADMSDLIWRPSHSVLLVSLLGEWVS